MTATLIARLVEKGLLSWDAPLEKMLPALADSMRPEYREVTLRDLLSHRSGLPENHEDQNLFVWFFNDRHPLPAQRMTYIAAALKDAPVGTKHAERKYSNTGFVIAGVIAEQATGKPYERLMLEEVFEPLGIKSVSFDQTAGKEEPCGHLDGRLADRPQDANPRMLSPAGGIRMTLDDWARFCIDQIQGSHGRGKLLKAETYRLLQTAQDDTRTGLGWGVPPTVLGRKGPALTHSGSDGNWYAVVVLFPETGDGLLVAANAGESMGGDKATKQLARDSRQLSPCRRLSLKTSSFGGLLTRLIASTV
jgi:CubicO group peptidase (beta-lactamase class C family)